MRDEELECWVVLQTPTGQQVLRRVEPNGANAADCHPAVRPVSGVRLCGQARLEVRQTVTYSSNKRVKVLELWGATLPVVSLLFLCLFY